MPTVPDTYVLMCTTGVRASDVHMYIDGDVYVLYHGTRLVMRTTNNTIIMRAYGACVLKYVM